MNKNKESIRTWYEAKTKKAIRWLITFGVTAVIMGFILFAILPHDWTLQLQIFNGAYSIPLGALIWIVVFTLIWMVPIREISFRTFESTEELKDIFREFLEKDAKPLLDEKIHPVIDDLKRLTKRLESRLTNEFFDKAEEALDGLAFSKEPLPVPSLKIPAGNGRGDKK